MAIDFPNSPTAGDIYTVSGKRWQWDGEKWQAYGASLAPDVLYVDQGNARVGINNTTPTYSIDVTGTARVTGAITASGGVVGNVTGNASGTALTVTQAAQSAITSVGTLTAATITGDLTVDTSTLKVDSSNNRVGIGTASPSSTLHVAGNIRTSSALIVEGTNATAIRLTQTDTDGAYISITETDGSTRMGYMGYPSNDDLHLKNETAAGLVYISTAATTRLTVTAAGNVGIGDTSPTHKLSVAGTASFTDSIQTGQEAFTIEPWSGSTIALGNYGSVGTQGAYASTLAWNWDRGTDSGYYHLNVNSLPQAGYFAIDSGGHKWGFNDSYSPVGWPTERMRLNQTGLGIGTATPNNILHLAGTTANHRLIFTNTANTVGKRGMSIGMDNNRMAFQRTDDSGNWEANYMIIDQDTGSVGIGTSTMTEKLNVIGHAFVQGPDAWNSAGDLAIVALGSGAANEMFGCGYKYGLGMILSTYKPSGAGSFGSNSIDALTIADTTAQITMSGPQGATLINYTNWAPNLQIQAPVHIKNWSGTATSPTEGVDWPAAILNLSTYSNYYWNSFIQFGMSNDIGYNTNLDLYWHISLYQSNTTPRTTTAETVDFVIMGPGDFVVRTGSTNRFVINSSGAVTIGGSLSKGSGTFDIAHPTKGGDWRLRHSFIEGPQADLIYRGTATLSGGTATVDLDAVSGMTDGTWEALNRDPWALVASSGNAVEWSLSGKTLTITSDTADVVCSWMVIGERQDDHVKSGDSLICDDDGYLIVEYEAEPETDDYPEWESAP